MASIPVILLFAIALSVVLTGVFILEAFVTTLYKGPGHRIVVSLLEQAHVPNFNPESSSKGFQSDSSFHSAGPTTAWSIQG